VLRWLLLVVVIGLAGAPASAARRSKKPPKPSWVVLVHSVGEVPSSWAGKLRVAAEKAQDRRWLDPPAVSIDEAAAVVGCSAWGPACAGQVAGMTGAQNALLIEIERKGAGAAISIEGVSAKGAVTGDAERVEVAGVDDDSLKIAQAWVQGAVRGARPTILVITSDLDPTEVVLDNAPAGKTPLTLVDGVAAGPHALLFKREGKAPLSRSIDVKAGTINREHGVLSAGGPAMRSTPEVAPPEGDVVALPTPTPEQPPPSPEAPLSPLALAGWGLTGVGSAVGVVGAGLGVVWIMDSNGLVEPGKDGQPQAQQNLCETSSGGFVHQGDFRCVRDIDDGDRDQDAIGTEVETLNAQAITAFVVAGVGVLVAATGAGLALAMAPGETADAAVVAPAR
jgi:hypothetical protein